MFTYSGDPAASPLDTVRFLLQDTDQTGAQLSDEEIAWLLTENVNDVYQAAIAACGTLSAKFTRRANKSVGDLSIQWGSVSKQYADLGATLRKQAMRHSFIAPYAGGITKGDMEIDKENDDIVEPAFTVGMDDNGNGLPPLTRTVPG